MTALLFIWLGEKPVHLDETNFLALTSGEFWGPHSIFINWEGKQQSAFDVLSNPPGIAWYLWIVRELGTNIQRWMMFPWAVLSLFGVYTFGEHWKRKGKELLLIWIVSPFFLISGNALMPDIPLFALIISGMALIWGGKYIHIGAFLCGLSVLFRYSGLCMVPLIIGWSLFYKPKKWWSLGFIVSSPTLFMFIHDLLFYDKWHFWHMISFQAEMRSEEQILAQIGACFGMLLGGFCWSFVFGLNNIKIWALGSMCTGVLCAFYGFVDVWDIWHYGFFLCGFSLVGHAISFYWQRKEFWFILWIIGGIVFLLNLRFMATRYWVPFIIPHLLFLVSTFSFRKMLLPAGIGIFISIFLAWDDYSLAFAQKQLAEQVELARKDDRCVQGFFAGHWGWQYYLESKKWIPIEDGQQLRKEDCIVYSEVAWSQEFQTNCPKTNIYTEDKIRVPIRVHSRYSRVNYHSNYLSSEPILIGFAPWGFGNDAWDTVHFFGSCNRF